MAWQEIQFNEKSKDYMAQSVLLHEKTDVMDNAQFAVLFEVSYSHFI